MSELPKRGGYRSKSKSEIAEIYAALDGGMPIEMVEKKFGVKGSTLKVWRRHDRAMSERKLAVTITGPEGMLEAMAKLLRDEGWTVVEPTAPPAFHRGRVEVLEGLMHETIQLWHEWSTTDITDDADRWAAFTDRAHAWLKRARVALPDPPPAPEPRRKARPRKKPAPKGRR